MLYDTNRYNESEKLYREALNIDRKLAEENPCGYLPDVARTCKNLAILLTKTHRLRESMRLLTEVLSIYRQFHFSSGEVEFLQEKLRKILYKDDKVYLNDEDGKEYQFELLDLIVFQGTEYVVLLPTEEPSGEVLILEVEDDENSEEENYVSVDDEETLYAVFDIFKQRFEDEFDFITYED